MPGKTTFEYFQGKAHWAKLNAPDLEYQNWNVKVYLTPESYDKFMALKEPKGDVEGILNEVRKEEDGYSVVFRRPLAKMWSGVSTRLAPPTVVDKDGIPYGGNIGNGSDITVKCEVYQYNKPFKKGKGTAIRMLAVKVDHLIPFERGEETISEANKKASKGLEQDAPVLF